MWILLPLFILNLQAKNRVIMKDVEQISTKISELRTALNFIQMQVENEFKKKASHRNIYLLRFLHKEYKIVEYAIRHLEWVVDMETEALAPALWDIAYRVGCYCLFYCWIIAWNESCPFFERTAAHPALFQDGY